jgi:hypothetical protein
MVFRNLNSKKRFRAADLSVLVALNVEQNVFQAALASAKVSRKNLSDAT